MFDLCFAWPALDLSLSWNLLRQTNIQSAVNLNVLSFIVLYSSLCFSDINLERIDYLPEIINR